MVRYESLSSLRRYCRALGFEERPDYKQWKRRFLDLVPGLGLSETPMYDPADNSSPPIEPPSMNATPLTHPSHPLLTIPSSPIYLPDLPDEDDGWYPVSSGHSPYIICAEDVLEDEKGIVRKNVGRIGEVPEMGRRRCFNKEDMLTEGEDEEDEESFGGPLAVGVYNRVEDY